MGKLRVNVVLKKGGEAAFIEEIAQSGAVNITPALEYGLCSFDIEPAAIDKIKNAAGVEEINVNSKAS